MKKIQILGPSDTECRRLTENAKSAARALGLIYKIEKVVDTGTIRRFGTVVMTPALAIDGQIRIAGRVASVAEIQKILILFKNPDLMIK